MLAVKGSCKEIADGFVEDAGAYPSRRIPAGIGQSAPRNTKSKIICGAGILIQKKMGNGSVAASNSDGRRVGGAGGKSDVGLAAARNSGIYRSDVVGIRTGKQGRKLKVGIAGLVGVEKVAVIIRSGKFPTVLSVEVSGGSDATATTRGGGTAKNPNGLVGGAVLTGIDVDEQLSVRPPPPQRQMMEANKDSFCFIRIY